MNKQQLASKIWESANKMRSKIEANEYKDYILGFIFYKFLSEKEVEYFKKTLGMDDSDVKDVDEGNDELVKNCKERLGYFISYDNLFSTWIEKGADFTVADVRDAINAFDRLIGDNHKNVFEKIFHTLSTGLSKLGDSSGTQTKAINSLINLIKDIPMNGRQDYDVLGFIYEYLISMFAANAGKKAGEFYTPHEVSLLMSEIIAEHLKERETIKIYDPTSGSGSLLINIGLSISKFMNNPNNIRYYAQELKENTYNLTRMNLVMRGILPDNIKARNGDTLAEDWPEFDESDRINTYEPIYVDAVVSNPPYSQKWEQTNSSEPRYSDYGIAPKSKADYAFLLHDLYHLKSDGIMSIVLPHGVLFRGGEEGEIRKNLIDKDNIEAIIGLPPNIFFGTGIPTTVMILKKNRDKSDILFVDASKGFVKIGNSNKLLASHIKKIVDTVINREEIPNYSRVVDKSEIASEKNNYNLNIPRYVDSSKKAETFDIYASVFGGIPNIEIDELANYWEYFTTLKSEIFNQNDTPYSSLISDEINNIISNNADVKAFVLKYNEKFISFAEFLSSKTIEQLQSLNIEKVKTEITADIFQRVQDIALVDKYKAYQLFVDKWCNIAIDLEIIQTEGKDAITQVDPHMVIKKKDNKEVEVQDGYVGHIIPFELVQQTLLSEKFNNIEAKKERIAVVSSEIQEILDNMSEEDRDSQIVNDDNSAFVDAEIKKELKSILSNIVIPEQTTLIEYSTLKTKEKLAFTEVHQEIDWAKIESSKNGTYSKTAINKYLNGIRDNYRFESGTYEDTIRKISILMEEEKRIKKEVKAELLALHALTKETIENLDQNNIILLLNLKWISPMVHSISNIPNQIIKELTTKVKHLKDKYETTLLDIEKDIESSQNELVLMIDDLVGDEYDMAGLKEIQQILKGDKHE